MEMWLIGLIVVVTAAVALLAVYLLVRRLKNKQIVQSNENDLTVTLPLPKPAPDATYDGMDPTQVEGIDYSSMKSKGSPCEAEEKNLVVTNEKLVDPSKKEEESSLSSSSIKKTEDASKDDAVCNERSERPVENNIQLPVADNNKDRQLLMFEAPPAYEESSSKTPSGTTRMVPMNVSQLDNTQNTNTSQCSTPASGPSSVVNNAPAPQLNLPKRLIPNSRSPNKFAGPRGETAAPVLLASTNSTETNVVFPPTPGTGKSPPANTITSMCRSEMDIGMNGEDAGRTPRVQSPITSGTGSLKTTNASTVVTFTPGSSTNEKEEKRY